MYRFPAKLFVLGEHTVLHGSMAYAVPLPRFSAEVVLDAEPSEDERQEQLDFAAWAAFAKTSPGVFRFVDVDRWTAEAHRLSVDSTIPLGYGLGSSGALTASIFARYRRNPPLGSDFKWRSSVFQGLEAYFHGKSSGLDPAVSWAGEGIVVDGEGRQRLSQARTRLPCFEGASGRWFLLDSGQPRAGKEAIAGFGESLQNEHWREKAFVPMVGLVNDMIEAHERGELLRLRDLIELSDLQFRQLSFIIPEHVRKTWQVLAQADQAYLKICGAGGGGYFLGYAPSGRLPAGAPDVLWLDG